MEQSVVRRINHLMVRAHNPQPLFSVLTEQLGLPVAWRARANSFFSSAGVHLGNTTLEIFATRNSRSASILPARLYGLAFALTAYSQSLPELDARRIAYTPPMPFTLRDAQGWLVTAWNRVYLGGLLDHGRLRRAMAHSLFALSHGALRQQWQRGANPDWINTRLRTPLLYDWIYSRGMTLGVEYNPSWYEANLMTETVQRGLELTGVREVWVGARDLPAAARRWRRLLAPLPEVESLTWQFESGPRLRLLQNGQDRLLAMLWQVRSLNRAAQYLYHHGMLGGEGSDQLLLAPAAVHGLDIRLVAG